MSQIHVIDPDIARRNDIARSIIRSHHHAEIYEDYCEFSGHNPRQGLALVSQDVGIHIEEALGRGECEMPFVLYGTRPAPTDVTSAIRAGALDFLVWPTRDADFGAALARLVAEGERRGQVIARIQDARRRVAGLTGREVVVLQMIVAGNSNKETAKTLGISPRTVEIHRANAMSKIGARSSADAVRIAICAGLDSTLKVTW
jgi:two-component system, LuxR family, response regulator FixJ